MLQRVCQLTFDFNGLLHLWLGVEHTLVLPAGVVADLLQTAEQKNNKTRDEGKNLLAKEIISTDFRHRACDLYQFLMKPQQGPVFPLSPVENSQHNPVHAQSKEIRLRAR